MFPLSGKINIQIPYFPLCCYNPVFTFIVYVFRIIMAVGNLSTFSKELLGLQHGIHFTFSSVVTQNTLKHHYTINDEW